MTLYWADTWAYQCLMDALESYWLSQPEEARVEINLQFLHINGERQDKRIVWSNPAFTQEEIANARKHNHISGENLPAM